MLTSQVEKSGTLARGYVGTKTLLGRMTRMAHDLANSLYAMIENIKNKKTDPQRTKHQRKVY